MTSQALTTQPMYFYYLFQNILHIFF